MKIISVETFLFQALLSISLNAAAAYETGESLLASCNAPNLSEHWYCLGYVVSAADTHTLLTCPPVGVAKSDLKRLVVKFLQENPGRLRESASISVLSALIEAFPCDEEKNSDGSQ